MSLSPPQINLDDQNKKRGRPPKSLINNNDKQCIRCNKIKNSQLFRKNRFLCLECHRDQNKKYYHENESYRAYKINKSSLQYIQKKQNQILIDTPLGG